MARKGVSAVLLLALLTAGCAELAGLSGGAGDAAEREDAGAGGTDATTGGHDAGGTGLDATTQGRDSSIRDAGKDAQHANDGHPTDTATPVDAGPPCRSPVEGGTPGVEILGTYCIDSTEAPVRLYQQFHDDLATNPASQPPECAWNVTFDEFYPAYASIPDASGMPQTSVNWCDALAYCTYWGKRLCGNRFDGGAVAPDAAFAQSEWYTACTGGTEQAYPYGNTYEDGACRDNLPNSALAAAVPTSTKCQGGVPGLFDMSGNLQEWENSCTPSGGDAANDPCVLRGGTYTYPSDSVTCGLRSGGAINPRNGGDTQANGIRCCWDKL